MLSNDSGQPTRAHTAYVCAQLVQHLLDELPQHEMSRG